LNRYASKLFRDTKATGGDGKTKCTVANGRLKKMTNTIKRGNGESSFRGKSISHSEEKKEGSKKKPEKSISGSKKTPQDA